MNLLGPATYLRDAAERCRTTALAATPGASAKFMQLADRLEGLARDEESAAAKRSESTPAS